MAEFTWTPDWQFKLKRAPRTVSCRFGDGYEQRASAGINNDPREYRLRLAQRDDAEAAAVEEFLTAYGPVSGFTWTPYHDAAGTWLCRTWERSYDDYENNVIEMTFEEIFEP